MKRTKWKIFNKNFVENIPIDLFVAVSIPNNVFPG